jgi:hypothetical protein
MKEGITTPTRDSSHSHHMLALINGGRVHLISSHQTGVSDDKKVTHDAGFYCGSGWVPLDPQTTGPNHSFIHSLIQLAHMSFKLMEKPTHIATCAKSYEKLNNISNAKINRKHREILFSLNISR